MQSLRKIAVAAVATLLVFTLFSFGFAWSIHQVFGTSKNIKHALDTSGVYQNGIAAVLDQQSKQQNSSTGGSGDIPVNNPEIRKVIEAAFPPQFLQAQADQVIDSAYGWLNSKTPSLQFSIDLSSAKTRLADGLGHYVSTHLASLPACAPSEIPSGDVNVLNATCLPPGVDPSAEATKARDQILNGDFLKDTTISADSIKNNKGETLSQQLRTAPKAYHQATLGVFAGGVLALVLAAGVIFLSSNWRAGIRKVAVIIITVGAVSAGLGWLSSFAVHRAALKIASLQTPDKALQLQVIAIVQSLANNLRTWWMAYGLLLAVLGVVALVVLQFTKTKQGNALTAAAEHAHDQSPAADPEKPIAAEPPKPPKPPRKVSG